MDTRSTARFVGLTLIMAAALAVSGCGGGGSETVSTTTRTTPTPPPSASSTPAGLLSQLPSRSQSSTQFHTFDSALRGTARAAQRRHIRTRVAEAAGHTPNSGSVTQSSTGAGGVTTDSVSVRVERDASGTASYVKISYTVTETGGWSVDSRASFDRASARVLAEEYEHGWEGIEFHQAPGGGRGSGTGPGLYVYVYTDIGAPAESVDVSQAAVRAGSVSRSGIQDPGLTTATGTVTGFSGTFNGLYGTFECTFICRGSFAGFTLTSLSGNLFFTPDDTDADYLAGGIWVRVPADAASVADYEFGAFMDGNDPFRQDNLAGLTGTATYEGDARAVYSHQETNRNYFVDGDVRLTADFGDAGSLGSISGTVSNFTGEGPGSNPYDYDGVSVSLGTAQIGNDDSGFFTGDTSTSGTDSTFTGKWGGQFYDNGAAADDHPGSVAGTFGAATADGSESFVGVYGADR